VISANLETKGKTKFPFPLKINKGKRAKGSKDIEEPQSGVNTIKQENVLDKITSEIKNKDSLLFGLIQSEILAKNLKRTDEEDSSLGKVHFLEMK